MTGYRIVVESDEHRHSSRDDAAHWVDTVAWLYTQAVAESVLRQQVSSLTAQLHEARLALGIAS
ncbi:hypothetical protein [Mycobacterium canetti]|uniref:hypothetical protein n=1 Tax=Mycobacterium canetti TaxID=78331 RepID=UPI001E62514B|nr:hypothetical protein [Mycobacterium canetti]